MKNILFKIVTGTAGLYHIVLGAIGLVFPIETVVRATTLTLGVTLQADQQLAFILKFVSVYMLAFGIMLIIFAFNPVRYRALLVPTLILFAIRLINRIAFFGLLSSTFGMTAQRNMIGAGLILFFFLAIWLTMPKKQQ